MLCVSVPLLEFFFCRVPYTARLFHGHSSSHLTHFRLIGNLRSRIADNHKHCHSTPCSMIFKFLIAYDSCPNFALSFNGDGTLSHCTLHESRWTFQNDSASHVASHTRFVEERACVPQSKGVPFSAQLNLPKLKHVPVFPFPVVLRSSDKGYITSSPPLLFFLPTTRAAPRPTSLLASSVHCTCKSTCLFFFASAAVAQQRVFESEQAHSSPDAGS